MCTELGITCQATEHTLRETLVDVAGLSELFRALADETRTKILYLLSQQELCVCDLAHLLDMTLPAVSHHLRLLKTMRLVRSRRDGKQVFYALDDDHILSLIEIAREHYIDQR
ncbi:MAG: ArsR/SmtB family transcription factor [Spirochaetota bacterium]